MGAPGNVGDPVVSVFASGRGRQGRTPKDPRPRGGAVAGHLRERKRGHRAVPPSEGNEVRREVRQEVRAAE
jgi:hypothetical protein